MIKVPFELNVWYRHRGNNQYIPARVDAALKAGYRICIRYRSGYVVHTKVAAGYYFIWGHHSDVWDIMAYQIVEKK